MNIVVKNKIVYINLVIQLDKCVFCRLYKLKFRGHRAFSVCTFDSHLHCPVLKLIFLIMGYFWGGFFFFTVFIDYVYSFMYSLVGVIFLSTLQIKMILILFELETFWLCFI